MAVTTCHHGRDGRAASQETKKTVAAPAAGHGQDTGPAEAR
ncbi:hypothetical protein [Streptomyces sp. NPDC051000]